MKCYFKFNTGFLFGILTPVLWLFFCWLKVIRDLSNNTGGFDLYFYLCCGSIWVLKAIVDFPGQFTIIWLAIKKQLLFEANEVYLYDHVSGIKFYWDDIEEVNNEEFVLHVKMHDPSKYLTQFKNPIDRFNYYSKKKKVFIINLSNLKADYKNLEQTLNDFSIQALTIQESKK
jgi:hypothetical protein